MRFKRTLALLGVALAWFVFGPWVLVLVAIAFAVPRSRARLWPWLRPTWRVVGGWAVAVLVLVGLAVVIPDGRLPIPPGPGAWVTPSYVGRPAVAHPIHVQAPQHPGLATNGASSMHNDAWATDTYPWAGPLGESPQVDTAWFGIEECATLAFDTHERLIALCGDLRGPTLHVLDPESMRPLASKQLPPRPDGHGKKPWENICAGAYFYLDAEDRAVVATTDRHVLVIGTSDGDGQPDLTTEASLDLSEQVPADDCLIAVMPDWRGVIWFETQQGRVGTVNAETGKATLLDLQEEIANSFAVDRSGAYVVTTDALYRLELGAGGQPAVTWRTSYDPGAERKPGQLSQGSGTTPTLIDNGLVAITDNADPQMHVAFYDRGDGGLVCQAPVFEEDRSATENSMVSVGTGVIVENNYGYSGPLSTILGRTTEAGLARVDVDVADGSCSVAWTSDQTAPTSVPKVSLANGLLYAYTKEHSWWGVNAWYLTAIDVRTGRRAFSVRTGLGTLMNNHYAAITIARDGSVYIATLAGMVRVRDRT